METASAAQAAIDRTEELYQNLEQAPQGSEYYMILDEAEYVKSPASSHRKVYGPATIRVRQFSDGGINMVVDFSGDRPERPRVYTP